MAFCTLQTWLACAPPLARWFGWPDYVQDRTQACKHEPERALGLILDHASLSFYGDPTEIVLVCAIPWSGQIPHVTPKPVLVSWRTDGPCVVASYLSDLTPQARIDRA